MPSKINKKPLLLASQKRHVSTIPIAIAGVHKDVALEKKHLKTTQFISKMIPTANTVIVSSGITIIMKITALTERTLNNLQGLNNRKTNIGDMYYEKIVVFNRNIDSCRILSDG